MTATNIIRVRVVLRKCRIYKPGRGVARTGGPYPCHRFFKYFDTLYNSFFRYLFSNVVRGRVQVQTARKEQGRESCGRRARSTRGWGLTHRPRTFPPGMTGQWAGYCNLQQGSGPRTQATQAGSTRYSSIPGQCTYIISPTAAFLPVLTFLQERVYMSLARR